MVVCFLYFPQGLRWKSSLVENIQPRYCKNNIWNEFEDAMRIFECPACGHKMRFNAPYCGKCHAHAPLKNMLSFYFLCLGVALVAALMMLSTLA